jgi:hypothetical protein
LSYLGIPRRNQFLNEAVEHFDSFLVRAQGDTKVAWSLLNKPEVDFIFDEIERCCTDPRYYLENWHVVMTEQEGLKTLYPFWDSQEIFYELVCDIQGEGRPVKLVVLKARQLGSSTLSQGLIFHKTIFNKGVNALIVAQDPSQADFLFSMSRLAYDSLPWWMRPEERYQAKGRYLILDKRDDMERQRRPGMKSQILVEAANKMTSAGRGKTIRCAHFSELASWEDGGVLSRSLLPTMNATDELAIMESTAEGRIGFWYEWWRQVANGDVLDWTPLFIPYYRVKKYSKPIPQGTTFEPTQEEKNIREKTLLKENFNIPDEVFNWVRNKKREFVALEGDEFGFYQEFPINDVEAFQSSGTCAYPKRLLHKILDSDCCPPRWYGEIEYHHQPQARKEGCVKLIDPVLRKAGQLHVLMKGEHLPPAREYGERLRVWELPESGSDYYVGADVAMGDGGDFSCAQVIRIGPGPEPDAQVAEWRGWISPTDFGDVLAALGYWYNEAQIACEANDVGVSTNNQIFRILEYPNIYRWKHVDKIKNFITDLFGWWTNHKTRDLIISKMREAIMERTLILRSEDLIDEMMAFTREEVGGRYEGRGTPDDRVMAMNITNYCAHDSDYGMESMGKDRKAVMSNDQYFIFDELNRLRFTAERENAEVYVRSHPGWSMTTSPAKVDFANSDYSPIHDKPGIRQELYQQGVPAEQIHSDLLLWADMEKGPRPEGQDHDDWRVW